MVAPIDGGRHGALPLQISMNDLGYVKLSKAYTTK